MSCSPEEFEIPFWVIDGLDASGKTTQAHRLAAYLQSQGKSVCLRVHPSNDNFFGANAKRFLQAEGKSAHFASAVFYMLDVIHSILKYSWQDWDYTIFVRYLLGTAYLPPPADALAYHFFATLVPKPTKTIYIDIQPEAASKRIKNRIQDKHEMFEKPEALQKMRQKGLSFASLGGWHLVHGGRSVAEVESDIHGALGLRKEPTFRIQP